MFFSFLLINSFTHLNLENHDVVVVEAVVIGRIVEGHGVVLMLQGEPRKKQPCLLNFCRIRVGHWRVVIEVAADQREVVQKVQLCKRVSNRCQRVRRDALDHRGGSTCGKRVLALKSNRMKAEVVEVLAKRHVKRAIKTTPKIWDSSGRGSRNKP